LAEIPTFQTTRVAFAESLTPPSFCLGASALTLNALALRGAADV